MATTALPIPEQLKSYEQYLLQAAPEFTQYLDLLKSLLENISTQSAAGMKFFLAVQQLQKMLVTQVSQTFAQLTAHIEQHPHFLNQDQADNLQTIIANHFEKNYSALLANPDYHLVFAQVINAAAALHKQDPQFTLPATQAPATEIIDNCVRDIVYQEDRVTLYHYKSLAPVRFKTPLLIVYALVNRPTILDLHPDRSLLRQLLLAGVDIYLIDWGYPTREDIHLNLNDYINGYLKRAVAYLCNNHHIKAVTLLGICQGGIMSLCYSALYPKQVKQLITMVTPVDFHASENILSQLLKNVDTDLVADSFGNISGTWIANSLLSLRPFRLLAPKYRSFIAGTANPIQFAIFTRMEQWLHDCPDHPRELFREFVKNFYQENKLVKNQVKIGRRTVNLKHLSMPVFNIYGQYDHLAPPNSTMHLGNYLGSTDYQTLSFKSGHIGLFVSNAAQQQIPAAIVTCLEKHNV